MSLIYGVIVMSVDRSLYWISAKHGIDHIYVITEKVGHERERILVENNINSIDSVIKADPQTMEIIKNKNPNARIKIL